LVHKIKLKKARLKTSKTIIQLLFLNYFLLVAVGDIESLKMHSEARNFAYSQRVVLSNALQLLDYGFLL